MTSLKPYFSKMKGSAPNPPQEEQANVTVLRPYFSKMKGTTSSPARVSIGEIFWSWLGSFLGIAAIGYIHYEILAQADLLMLVGSFGAAAVLLFAAPLSPLAQPRNFIIGNFLSALIGVACYNYLGDHLWFAAAVAVSVSIAVMQATRTLHPPGGATAIIAVIGSQEIHDLGYFYALMPITTSVLLMLTIALLVNNLSSKRSYPLYWF